MKLGRLGVFLAGFCLVAAVVVGQQVSAHEVRPAYLSLTEISADGYEMLWKQPLLGERRLPLEPALPRTCRVRAARADTIAAGALVQRSQVECPGGLRGARVGIDGLAATLTDVLLRVEWLDGAASSTLLRPETAFVTLDPAGAQSAVVYFWLGVEHLLLGVDHVLFVLTLMFFIRRVGPLVKTVTAFTVAHSLTLGLSALEIVRLPQASVEAVIALSIVFLAVERLRGDVGTITARHTWIVAFAFGLLHGFGFAGALQDMGLPRDNVLAALFLFNLGVEVGQLMVIGLALGVRYGYPWLGNGWSWIARGWPPWWSRSADHARRADEAVAVGSTAATLATPLPLRMVLFLIGGIAAYWFLDRLAAIFVAT